MANVKIEVVPNAKLADDFFKSIHANLVKSGASKEGSELVKTGIDNALLAKDVISNDEYLALCKDNNLSHDGRIIEDETERKEYLESLKKENKKVVNKDRIFRFKASDESTDRSGDIIRVSGWNLANFKKNPVFMSFHETRKAPCGTVLRVWKELNDQTSPNGKSLMIDVYFPEGVQSSDDMFLLIDNGLINAVSVGFKPTKANDPTSEDERKNLGLGKWGVEFLAQELLEVSAVPVPDNQNCLLVKDFDQKAVAKRVFADLEIKTQCEFDAEVLAKKESETFDTLKELKSITLAFSECVKSLTDAVINFAKSTENMNISIKIIDGDAKGIDEEELKKINDKDNAVKMQNLLLNSFKENLNKKTGV